MPQKQAGAAPFYGWALYPEGKLVVLPLDSARDVQKHKNLARGLGGPKKWGGGPAPVGMSEAEVVRKLQQQTRAREVEIARGGVQSGPFHGPVATSNGDLRQKTIRLAHSMPAGSEARRALIQVLAETRTASDLQFDRFFKGLDAIRKKITDANDPRILDLAVEHVATYVRGGSQKGYLPRSFPSKYNRMLKGLGIAGLSGDMSQEKQQWLSIVDEMEKSARRLERKHN